MAIFGGIAKRLFGSSNDRVLKGLEAPVADINALEPAFEDLSPHPGSSDPLYVVSARRAYS